MGSIQCKMKIQNIGKSMVFSSSQSAAQPLDKIGFQICVCKRHYQYVVFAKSTYFGHPQDYELVTLTAKVHNRGDLFISSNSFFLFLFIFCRGLKSSLLLGCPL